MNIKKENTKADEQQEFR